MDHRRGVTADLSGWLVYAAVALFVLVVGSIFLTVLLNSFASSWFGGVAARWVHGQVVRVRGERV